MPASHEPSDPTKHTDSQGAGQARGRPAAGTLDDGSTETTQAPGLHHWRESTITDPDLQNRGGVFFAAIEMTRMPMVLTDPNIDDNPIVFANKAFLDLTGYEEEEVLGRNCRFLQGAQTDRNSVAELREAVTTNGSVALEILNYRRDGTPFWNAVFVGPVYDTAGKLQFFFASQLDVTRRRNTEQSYRQAQKMESIGQLTAGLAHDFNNLLQVVNGNLELVTTTDDPDRVKRYVAAAQLAAERGAKLTRQLLAFARKTRLEPRAVNLTQLVSEFSDLIDSSVNKQVDIHLSLRRGLPYVVLDPDQLEMALLNIVNNARDAMTDGGLVTIATRPIRLTEESVLADLEPGDYVVLEVQDDGPGMDPAVVERATEPFFTTKGVGKGTGLGLAMASGFVRQSGGRLEIESTPGAGTVVRMLFPVRKDVEAERPRAAPRSEPDTGGFSGPAHILVVEDNEEVLTLAREILEGAGYRVSTAMTGDDGLRLFDEVHAETRIDLLFTDLVMPGGMNGLMLGDAIVSRDPSVSILMTTGYNEELVVDGRRARESDVLSKPYRHAELLDRVRQALNRRGEGGDRRRRSDFGAAQA
ncbi:histidine kinase famiy protein [Sphingomonas sp.]|jgi:PAS domain S-box-containing protein|uniref:histidine kinase famiy protein n=1 Tax=Sphingomonas sp. TaxID=28214 RepID=UPI00260EEEBA|nr:histidine kinase famiy protein [Sphingomonas sp.]MDF2493784.1 hybrid sensor histidine kinase/response regulator [Sphingomonas sp.]